MEIVIGFLVVGGIVSFMFGSFARVGRNGNIKTGEDHV